MEFKLLSVSSHPYNCVHSFLTVSILLSSMNCSNELNSKQFHQPFDTAQLQSTILMNCCYEDATISDFCCLLVSLGDG